MAKKKYVYRGAGCFGFLVAGWLGLVAIGLILGEHPDKNGRIVSTRTPMQVLPILGAGVVLFTVSLWAVAGGFDPKNMG